jgi:hypothetical protein
MSRNVTSCGCHRPRIVTSARRPSMICLLGVVRARPSEGWTCGCGPAKNNLHTTSKVEKRKPPAGGAPPSISRKKMTTKNIMLWGGMCGGDHLREVSMTVPEKYIMYFFALTIMFLTILSVAPPKTKNKQQASKNRTTQTELRCCERLLVGWLGPDKCLAGWTEAASSRQPAAGSQQQGRARGPHRRGGAPPRWGPNSCCIFSSI